MTKRQMKRWLAQNWIYVAASAMVLLSIWISVETGIWTHDDANHAVIEFFRKIF
jgi:hypothetical protein